MTSKFFDVCLFVCFGFYAPLEMDYNQEWCIYNQAWQLSSAVLLASGEHFFRLLSVVCLSVNLSHFHPLLLDHGANFIHCKLFTKHPWVKGFEVCSNEQGPVLFQEEMIAKLWRKYFDVIKKNCLHQPTEQIYANPGTKHPRVKGIQVLTIRYSNRR